MVDMYVSGLIYSTISIHKRILIVPNISSIIDMIYASTENTQRNSTILSSAYQTSEFRNSTILNPGISSFMNAYHTGFYQRPARHIHI